MQREMFDLVERFVVLNETARQMLLANGSPATKLSLNRLGLSQSDAARKPSPDAQPTRRPVRFGFVGRLHPSKGVTELVRAAISLPRACEFSLEIRGPAPDEFTRAYAGELREQAAGDPRVMFPDAVSSREIPDVLARLDALIIPSMWFENGPTIALESMAVGTPIVASRVGNLAEIIEDRVTGRLVPPGDVGALAAVLSSIADDPAGSHRSVAPSSSNATHDGRRDGRLSVDVRRVSVEVQVPYHQEDHVTQAVDDGAEAARLKTFWNSRYSDFSLSESGWKGAGEDLNHLIYSCKLQALERSLQALHLRPRETFTVLDAGCGQGFFPRFYNAAFPSASYVGIDISERAVEHLRASPLKGEFHVADLTTWRHPEGKKFDVVQSFEVLDMILDDDAFVRAIGNLARQMDDGGAMLVTAALLESAFMRGNYLRYRSAQFWMDTLKTFNLKVVSSRPMYYWLPAGGPTNRYLRFVITRLGVRVMYVLDRVAMALHLPRPRGSGPDCRMELLTIKRQEP